MTCRRQTSARFSGGSCVQGSSSASGALALPEGVVVLERGWLSANGILFVGAGSSALVDTGYCTHAVQTVGLVERALSGSPLDLVLNTHLHSDHCGGNAALQVRYPGLQTRIPPGLASHVVNWDPVALTYVPTGQSCPQFSISGLLVPGTEIELGGRAWQIHAAPGHDPHSVVLFEPDSRVLISADALWERGFGVVFEELEGRRAFDEVGATLDLIEALAPVAVIPGHGPVFTDVTSALLAARRRLAGFMADPVKHAVHAAKVLLKFKLLELQEVELTDFAAWADRTPYFGMVRCRWFPSTPLADWIRYLADQLVASGAAIRVGTRLVNA